MLACLITIWPRDSVGGSKYPVRMCSIPDRRVCGLGGFQWEPCISKAPTLGMQFWNGDFSSGSDTGKASFTVNHAQLLRSAPETTKAVWAGARVEIRIGRVGSEWPWKTYFDGLVTSYSGDEWPTLSITAEVNTEPFDADLLTDEYAGTGDAEGGDDLADQVKPLALGHPLNVEPTLINSEYSIYQFSAYGPIEAVVALYERASLFPSASSNYATYDDLLNADIDPGHWSTCLDEGLIRLGAPAYGVITGDIKGHAVDGSAPTKAGDLCLLIADIAGIDPDLIDTAAFKALDAEGATATDVMVTDQVTAINAMQRIVLPCNWQVIVSNTGMLTLMKPEISEVVDMTLHAQGRREPVVSSVTREDTSVPYWKTTMSGQRNWRVQTFDEISTSATLVDRGDWDESTIYREGNIVTLNGGFRYVYVSTTASAGIQPGTTAATGIWEQLGYGTTYADGTLIDDLKPAESGADATSSIVGQTTISVPCDMNGVPLEAYVPLDVAYALYRGDTDITSSATWSVEIVSGTIDGSIDSSSGVVTITDLGSTAILRITAVVVNITRKIDVTVVQDKLETISSNIETSLYRAELSKPSVSLGTYGDGGATSYDDASGSVVVTYSRTTDVSSHFTLSVLDNPQSLTVDITGQNWAITGGGTGTFTSTTVTFAVTGGGSFTGIDFTLILSVLKFEGGVEIVDALPTTNLYVGRVVFLTTDEKLYRCVSDGGSPEVLSWSVDVDGSDIITGTITAAKLAVTQLSAISANLGTVSAGAIMSAGKTTDQSESLFQLEAGAAGGSLKLYHANGQLAVYLGV